MGEKASEFPASSGSHEDWDCLKVNFNLHPTATVN